jgi:amino acid permease
MNTEIQYDKLWIGILAGLCVPFAAYGILLMIYDKMDYYEIFNPVGMAPGFRERTIALLAIICNIIPLQIFNKRNLLESMRGIIFPTLFYVVLWMYYYGMDLLRG